MSTIQSMEELEKIYQDEANSDMDAPTSEPIETSPQEVPESDIEGAIQAELDKPAETEPVVEPQQEAVVETPQPEGETPAAPEFDFSYKFQDEIHEFDDRVKAAIKTKEDEEYFRELITASKGMHLQKKKWEEADAKYHEVNNKYTKLEQDFTKEKQLADHITTLLDGIKVGDASSFDKLIQASGASREALTMLGSRLASLIENPEQHTQLQHQHQVSMQQKQYEQMQAELAHQQEIASKMATDSAINSTLTNDPEVAEVAQAIDSRLGAGSFVKEVWNQGSALAQAGHDIDVSQIPEFVKQIANHYRTLGVVAPKQEAPTQQAAPSPQGTIIGKKVVTDPSKGIPKVEGNTSMPVHGGYKSGQGVEYFDNMLKEIEKKSGY